MKIEKRGVDDVIPYKNNPRRVDDQAVTKVAASIKEFGFKQPIVVDKQSVSATGQKAKRAATAATAAR